jgi:hypothetical protein
VLPETIDDDAAGQRMIGSAQPTSEVGPRPLSERGA